MVIYICVYTAGCGESGKNSVASGLVCQWCEVVHWICRVDGINMYGIPLAGGARFSRKKKKMVKYSGRISKVLTWE